MIECWAGFSMHYPFLEVWSHLCYLEIVLDLFNFRGFDYNFGTCHDGPETNDSEAFRVCRKLIQTNDAECSHFLVS